MTAIVEGVRITMRLCANPKCMIAFEPSRHNQKYCGKECCKVVTNAKIMEQYYEEKDRKAGVPRTCVVCDEARLSRYNSSNTCSACVAKQEQASRRNLLASLGVK